MRNRIIILAGALVVVFLLGYVPPYSKSARLESELRQATVRSEELELRDLAAYLYLQAIQKNYGMAGQSSTEFFNRVQQAAGRFAGEKKKALDEVFSYRDKVTTLLARGDPAVLLELQNLYLKTRAATTP